MKDNDEILIRKADISDIVNLKEFFIKAYGKQTIFQDRRFLLYYFNSYTEKTKPFSYSLIGLNPEGKIVSHYGGLYYKLKLNQKIITTLILVMTNVVELVIVMKKLQL